MKPAMYSVMFLLFLVLVSASTCKGARLLEGESLASPQKQVHEESLMKEGISGVRDALPCGSGGHCSGKSRKLMTTHAMATSKSERSNDMGVDSAQNSHKNPKGEVHRTAPPPPVSKQPHTYPDILDIAGMDYSPAKRKPPIHN